MIPKIIHYCWFGKGKKSRLVQDCLASWKQYLSDYEIKEWNESNCDLSHPFVKKAYKEKKWAFVSDYIRLKKIHEIGGVYLDTDMILCKSLNNLLDHECFLGAENNQYINCAIIGAGKGNLFIERVLEEYNNILFSKKLKNITIPKIATSIYKEIYGDENFDKIITNSNVTVYPYQYFYPFPFNNKKDLNNYINYVLPESYTVHLWCGSWLEVDLNEFQLLRKRQYYDGFLKMLKKSNNKKDYNYYKKIVSSIKHSLSKEYYLNK